MYGEEFEYMVQDFFREVDDNIRTLNEWWYEWGPAWLTWIGGGDPAFPVPAFALRAYQWFIGANPKADEETLIALAEHWLAEAAKTAEYLESVTDDLRGAREGMEGPGVPAVFDQQANSFLGATSSLMQTQLNLATGSTQFAVNTVSAKASFWAQVALLMVELATAIAALVPTLGVSGIVAGARAFLKAFAIRKAMQLFLDRIRAVTFTVALKQMGRAALPKIAMPLRALSPATLRHTLLPPVRNLTWGKVGRALTAPVRGMAPSAVAGRRAATQIQRQMIREARQNGAGLVQIAQLGSGRMRNAIARSVTQQLRGRGPLTAAGRGVNPTQLDLVNNAVRQAVGNGLTTWSVIRQGLIGYGVRSALIYGAGGWVLKEAITHSTLHRLDVNDLLDQVEALGGGPVPRYRSRFSELAGSVVGAGLGGAPLAFGATAPQMALYGGIGGGLGYFGSRITEAAFDPDLSLSDLGREFSGLLRAGGADTLLDAVAQGALGGGIWERYIGERGLDDVRAGFGDLSYAVGNFRGALDLSGMVGDVDLAGLSGATTGTLPANLSGAVSGTTPGATQGTTGSGMDAGRASAPPAATQGSGGTSSSGGGSSSGTNSGGGAGSGTNQSGETGSRPPSDQQTRSPQPDQAQAQEAPAPRPQAEGPPRPQPQPQGEAPPQPQSQGEAPPPERPDPQPPEQSGQPEQSPPAEEQPSAAGSIGDVHIGPEHRHSPPPRPDLDRVALSDEQRQQLAESLREQVAQAESQRQAAAAEGPLRRLLQTADHRPDLDEGATRTLRWSSDQLGAAVDAVLEQAAGNPGKDTWKPVGDAWHVQGTFEGQRFTLELGADGSVRAAYLGGFADSTTGTGPDGIPVPERSGPVPPLAKQALSGLFHQLADEGHATIDRDAGVVTFHLADGSVLDVRFAVDAAAPEGHWYVQGGRHEFTPAGWQQREPVTVVLSGEVRTDQTAMVADLRGQVLQALSQVVADLPGPVGARAVAPATGRTVGAAVAPPGTTWQSLPTTVRVVASPAGESTTEAPDPAQLLERTFRRFQAGELAQETTGERTGQAPDAVVAISGDPASGVKLAHYADGSTVAFTVETAALPSGDVIVKPAQWTSDGRQWRQWNATRILLPEAVTGDPDTAADQVTARVVAGLRAQHATLPGNDTPHQRFNRTELERWQQAVQGGPVPVDSGAAPAADPSRAGGGRIPVDQVVPVALGDDRLFVRFQFPTGPGEARLTLPHLGLLDGRVWQMSPATVTLPGVPATAQTWDHPQVRAALHQLAEAVARVGPVDSDALRMEHAPASAPLAGVLSDIRIGERGLRPLLLADPLPAAATGADPVGPRYLVRIPGEVSLVDGARAVLDGLRERGYQVEGVTDQWSTTGEPGLVLTARAPFGNGAAGEAVELRLLPPEAVVARQEVARQLTGQPRPPEEIRRQLDLYAGRQRPVGLAQLEIPTTDPASPDPYRIVAEDQLPEGGPYQLALNLDGLLDRHDRQGIPVTESLPPRREQSAPVLVVSDPNASLVQRYQTVAAEVAAVADRIAERGFGGETRAAVGRARDWARRLTETGRAYLADRADPGTWRAWQEVAQEAEPVVDGLRAEERRFATGTETQLATDRFTLPAPRTAGELAHRAQQLADALGSRVDLRVTDPAGATSTRTFTPAPTTTPAAPGSSEAAPASDTGDPAPSAVPSSRVRMPVSPAAGPVRPQPALVESLLDQQLPELAVTGRIPDLVRADRLPDGSLRLEFVDRTVTAQVRVRPDLPAGEAVVRPGLIEISGQLPDGGGGRLVNAVVLSRAVTEYHTLARRTPVPAQLDLDGLLDHLTRPDSRTEDLAAAVAARVRQPDGSVAPVVLSTGDPLTRQVAFHQRLGELLDTLASELHRLETDGQVPARSRRSVAYQRKQAARLRVEVDRRRDLPARIRAAQARVGQARQAWEATSDPADARAWQTAQRQLDRLRKQWDRAVRSGEDLLGSARAVDRELARVTGREHTDRFAGLAPPPADPVRVAATLARELATPLRLEMRAEDGATTYEIDPQGSVTATEHPVAPAPVAPPAVLDLDELPAARTGRDVPTLVEAAVAALAGRPGPGEVVRLTADPLAQRMARVEEAAELARQLADEAWGPVDQALRRTDPGDRFDRLADAMTQLGEVMAHTTAVSQAADQLRQARQELADLRRAADARPDPGADLRAREQSARAASDVALVRWRAAVHRLTELLPTVRAMEQLVRDELDPSLPVTLEGVDSSSLAALDPVTAARELARQTGARVELTLTQPDGSVDTHRFLPDGTLAPRSGGEGPGPATDAPAQQSPATSAGRSPQETPPAGEAGDDELPAGDNTRAGLLMGTALEELPYLEQLAEALNQRLSELGVDETVTPPELHELIQDKFRNAVARDGAVHTFGQKHRRQFQIKVSLTEPRRVRSEVKPHAQIQANMGQGHWGRSGGQDRVNTAGLAVNVGMREETQHGLLSAIAAALPGFGADVSARLAQMFDTRQYAEVGFGVVDNRGPAVPTEVRVSYEVTPLAVRKGEPDTPIRVGPEPGEQPRTLRFAVPENFYQRLDPADTVRRPESDWPSAGEVPHWAVLEMSGRDQLVEEVTRILTAQKIKVTDSIRDNLRDHFWALQADVATAAKAPHGYRIPIVDDGKVVGWLGHRLEVLREHAQPVGKPSNEYRLEQVGVTFNRVNGGASAGSGRNFSATGAEKFGLGGGGSRGGGRSGGFNAESTAIRVQVDKNREWNQFYQFGAPDRPGVRHQFQVFDAGARLLGDGTVDGTLVVATREADAYAYGLPVAREALGSDGTLRGTPVLPDGERPLFPEHLRSGDGTGVGSGVGIVRNFVLFDPVDPARRGDSRESGTGQIGEPAPDPAPVHQDRNLAPDPSDPSSRLPGRTAPQNILSDRIRELLRNTDFLVGDDSGIVPDGRAGRLRRQLHKLDARVRMGIRLIRMFNEQELERQLTTAALQTRYDELAQDFIELTLYAPKWSSLLGPVPVLEFTERIIRVSLVQHVDRATFRGYTADRDNTHLTIGRQATGRATGSSRSRSLIGRFFGYKITGNWGRDGSMDVANARHDVYLFDHGAGDAEVKGDDRGPHHHKIAVWEVPHTVRVEFVGQPESTFELPGKAEVSMAASFIHADQQPVPVTGLEVTGYDGTPVELLQYNSSVPTALNTRGVTRTASDLVERLGKQVAAVERAGDLAEAGTAAVGRRPVRLPRLRRGLRWAAIANPMGEVRHAVDAVANVDRIMSEFPSSVIDDGTGRREQFADNGLRGDQVFQTGLGPDVRYGIRVGTRLHGTDFLGIVNVGTTGRFTFRLASLFANATYRGELSPDGVETALGAASPSFGRSIVHTVGRIFGVERLPLNFEKHRYHFRTRISTQLDVTASGAGRKTGQEVVRDGWITWTLAESDAMDAYGKGLVALPAAEVARSLRRWTEGDLTLKRVVAARAVRRLVEETATADGESGYRPLLDHLLSKYDASERTGVPADGPLPEVLTEVTRLIERHPYDPLARKDITLPDYLSRDDLFALGFTGIEYLNRTSVKVDGVEKPATQVNQLLRELTDALTGGGVTRESGDVPAPVGSLPGLGAAIDGATVEAGIRAALDTMLDGTDGTVVAAGEIPHQLPAPGRTKALARFPVSGERFEIVARARRTGPVTVTGEMANLGSEQQQYRYRQKIVKVERSSRINLGTGLLARLGWTGLEMGTARGQRISGSENWQRTTIRTQTNWSGATMAEVPIVVEFELRRYPSRVRSPFNRALARLYPGVIDRPKTTRVEVAYDLGLHLPKGLVREQADPVQQAKEAGTLLPERAAAPPGGRWRILHRGSWLPSRFGVDHVQAQPLREAAMDALAQLLGDKRAEELREAVHQQLSADAVPANLDRMASPYGYDALPGLPLPSDLSTRVDTRITLQFTVAGQRELPEGFGTGIIDRYQWLQELSWGRNRPAPFNLGQGVAQKDEDGLSPQADSLEEVGGKASGGGQAGYGQSGWRGQRIEKTSKETGPVVELRLRYSASVEATTSVDSGAGAPLALESGRVVRPDAARGYIHLRIYRRDLPELKRLLAEQPAWDFVTATGLGEAAPARLIPHLLEQREQHVPELSLPEVLGRAFDRGYDADDPGPALGAAIRDALPELHPNWLVRLTVDPLAHSRTVADQLLAEIRQAVARTEQRANDVPRPEWEQVRQKLTEAATLAETIRDRAEALAESRRQVAELEQRLSLTDDPEIRQRLRRAHEQRWKQVHGEHQRRYEDWQAALAAEHQLREAAARADAMAARLDQGGPVFARPVYRLPVGELELVRTVREAAAELQVELDLRVDRPVGHRQVSHRLAPDGAWHRPDRGQALAEELLLLTRRHHDPPRIGPEGEELRSPDLLDRAVRLRLDLAGWFEEAGRQGVPLAQLVADARNLPAAEAAWAGVDVDREYAEADRRAQAGERVDRDARLAELTRQAEERWRRLAPGFHRALRVAEATPEQLTQAVAAGTDLVRVYQEAHDSGQDPAVALRQALTALPPGRPATTLTELAELFGVPPSPRELGRFRALLTEAGLLRGPEQAAAPDSASGQVAAPTPAEAALLRELATELAVRHGLSDPVQRGRVLQFDPDWVDAVVSHRPVDLPGAALVQEPPPLPDLSAADRQALDTTVGQIVDRYYHGLPVDRADRGQDPLSPQERARIRWLVHRYGVPAAALYTSRLPGARFQGPLVDRDLLLDTGDPNLPSARQQWFLNTTGRTTGWVAPGDGAFFEAFFRSLPEAAREHLAQRFGITSARELTLDLTEALREQLDAQRVGPLWRRADSLTSHIQRATALAALTDGGSTDSGLHDHLPALVADRYGLEVLVRPPSGERESAVPTEGDPVATVQLLRTGTHYLPVSPDDSSASPGDRPDPTGQRGEHQRHGSHRSVRQDPSSPVRSRSIQVEQLIAGAPDGQVVDALSRVVASSREPVVSLLFDPVAARLDEVVTAAEQVAAVAEQARVAVWEARTQAVAAASTTQSQEASQAAATAARIADRIVAETRALHRARTEVTEATVELRRMRADPSTTRDQITVAEEVERQARRRVGVAQARWQVTLAEHQAALTAAGIAERFARQRLRLPLDNTVDGLRIPDGLGDPAVDPVTTAAETARRTGRVVWLTVVGDDGGTSERVFNSWGEPVAPSPALVAAVAEHAAAVRDWQRSARRQAGFRRQRVMPLLRQLGVDRSDLRDPDRLAHLADRLTADPATAEVAAELYEALVRERALAGAVEAARRATRLPAARRMLLEHFGVSPEGLLVGGPDDQPAPGQLDAVGVTVDADGRIRLVVLDLDTGPGAQTGGRPLHRGSPAYLEHQLKFDRRLQQRLRERPELWERLREAATAGELVIDYQLVRPGRDGSVRLHPYHLGQLDLARIVDRSPTAPPGPPPPDGAEASGPVPDSDVDLTAAVDDFGQRLRARGELSEFTLERTGDGLLLRVRWPDGRAAQARLVSDGRTVGLRPEVDESGYPVVGLRPVTADPAQRRLLVGLDLRPALTVLRERTSADGPTGER